MKINSIIKAKCKDLSFEGKGVCFYDGDTIFVDGLFIDEEADILVSYKRNGVYFGKIKKLYNLSKDRIPPKCKVCTACGGCQFQQLSYDAQLKYKQTKVKQAFKRVLHKDLDILPTIGMDNPYNYRNKIQLPIGKDKKGNIITGFYRNNTHEIIAIDECFIEDIRAKHIVSELKSLIKDFKYDIYDEDTGYGLFRHILIRTSAHYDEIMLTLVTTVDEFKGRNNFVKELIKRCPEITSIVQNINKRHTNVILGEKERSLYGPSFIKDSILGVNFLISSKSFFQVNPIQVEKLYSVAINAADLKQNENVFDAYCGIGTIALIASKYAKSVTGVEIVEEAIKDANKNMRLNNINNAKFVCNDAGEELEKEVSNGIIYDTVFVDPPRKGLSEKFVNSLLRVKPNKIVYVSCDPDTLARDINILNKEYSIKFIQPVDMFPMTFHVETVVSLIYKRYSD